VLESPVNMFACGISAPPELPRRAPSVYSLVQQIVDAAGAVPVLVKGSVATGRHVAAGLALGATGVWIGTAWLLSKEHQANIHSVNTKRLKAAGSENTGNNRSESGKTFRQIRAAWSQE
jgi:NAD(P)H-dependent flavin oxidoreductase YrpB (nitropropane dioxygenase family)